MYAGPPENPEDYHQVDSNGLKIFVSKNAQIDSREGIRITLSGKGIWRRLNVQGIRGYW